MAVVSVIREQNWFKMTEKEFQDRNSSKIS